LSYNYRRRHSREERERGWDSTLFKVEKARAFKNPFDTKVKVDQVCEKGLSPREADVNLSRHFGVLRQEKAVRRRRSSLVLMQGTPLPTPPPLVEEVLHRIAAYVMVHNIDLATGKSPLLCRAPVSRMWHGLSRLPVEGHGGSSSESWSTYFGSAGVPGCLPLRLAPPNGDPRGAAAVWWVAARAGPDMPDQASLMAAFLTGVPIEVGEALTVGKYLARLNDEGVVSLDDLQRAVGQFVAY
jgi:hypothetical protein